MKIVRSFVVELDGAKFYFKKPDIRSAIEIKGLGTLDTLDRIFKDVQKIEGLTDEDGTPIDTNGLITLPLDAAAKILKAYNDAAFSSFAAEVSPEKKESATI